MAIPEDIKRSISIPLSESAAPAQKKEVTVDQIKKVKAEVADLLQASPDVTEPLSLKDFSHMFSSRTYETSFEGGKPLDKYTYWKSLLPSLKGKISDKAYAGMEKVVADGLFFFEKEKSTPESVREKIKNLGEGESFYLPSGWSSPVEGMSHSTVVKFTKMKDGSIQYYAINKGGGISGSHKIHYDGVKEKLDFRSSLFSMSGEKFSGEFGKDFLNKLLSLNSMPVTKDIPTFGYDAYDFYGLLGGYSDSVNDFSVDEAYIVTPQRTGNCSQASLFCAFTDAEISVGGVDKEMIKIDHFRMKEKTLVVAFQQYKEILKSKADPDDIFLFRDAVNEHLTRALKLQDKISPEEFIKAELIGKTILKHLDEFEKKAKSEKSTQPLSLNVESDPIKPEVPKIIESKGVLKEEMAYEAAIRPIDHLTISYKLNPKNVLDYLDNNIALARTNLTKGANPVEVFNELCLLAESLPDSRTTIDEKFFYDSLSEKDSEKLIGLLRQLNEAAMECLMHVESGTKEVEVSRGKKEEITKVVIDKGKLFEISMKAYDISAQVAPNISGLGLEEYEGFSFDLSYIDDTRKLSDPKTQACLEKIKRNFAERNKLSDAAREKLKNHLKHELKGLYRPEKLPEILEEKVGHTKLLLMKKVIKDDTDPLFDYMKRQMGDRLFDSVVNHKIGKAGSILFDTRPYVGKAGLLYHMSNPTRIPSLREEDPAKLYKLEPLHSVYYDLLAISRFGQDIHPQDFRSLKEDVSCKTTFYDSDINEAVYYDGGGAKYTFPLKQHRTVNQKIKNAEHPSENIQLKHLELHAGESSVSQSEAKIGKAEREVKLAIWNLGRFQAEPNMAPILGLIWAKTNAHLLHNGQVRKKFEQIIFQNTVSPDLSPRSTEGTFLVTAGSALAEKFKTAPEVTADVAIQFLKAGLQSCNPDDSAQSETYLWFLELSEKLQSIYTGYAKEGAEVKVWPNTTKLYEDFAAKHFEGASSKKIALSYLAHFRFYPPTSPKNYNEIFVCLSIIANNTTALDHSVLEYGAYEVIAANKQKVVESLNNLGPAALKTFSESLMKKLVPGYLEEDTTSWEIKDGILKGGRYEIIVESGKLFQDKKPFASLGDTVERSDLYKAALGNQRLIGVIRDGYFYSHDGKIRCVCEEKAGALQLAHIEKEINGTWYRFEKEVAGVPQNISSLIHVRSWVSCDKGKPGLYIESKQSGELLYHICEDGTINVKTKAKVADLNNREEPLSESWGQILKHIEPPEYTFLEVKGKVVTALSFPRLGLNFSLKDGKLFSTELKGFYLDLNASLPFKNYSGIIALVNDKGEKKYILPSHPASPISGIKETASIAMTTKITVDSTALMNPPFFVFQDVGKHVLKADTPQGALHMAILLRNEKRYEEAIFYLDAAVSSHSLSDLDLDITQQVVAQPDYSAEGAVFDLHLALRMHSHEKKISKETIPLTAEQEDERMKKIYKIKQHFSKQAVNYRTHISNWESGIFQIPQRLRFEGYKYDLLQKLYPYESVEENMENTLVFDWSKVSLLLTSLKEGGKLKSTLVLPPPPHLLAEAAGYSGVKAKIAEMFIKKMEKRETGADVKAEKLPLRIIPAKEHPRELVFLKHLQDNYGKYLAGLIDEDEATRKKTFLDLVFFSRSEPMSDEIKTILDTLLYAFSKPNEFREISALGLDVYEKVVKQIITCEGGDEIFFSKAEKGEASKVAEESKDVKDSKIAEGSKKSEPSSAPSEPPRQPKPCTIDFSVDTGLAVTEFTYESKGISFKQMAEEVSKMDVRLEGKPPTKELPLEELHTEYFQQPKESKKTETKELFSDSEVKLVDDADKLRPGAKKKLQQMNKGIAEVESIRIHALKDGVSVEKVKEKALTECSEAKSEAKKLKNEIILLANKKPKGVTLDKHISRAKRAAKHGQYVVLEDVVAALLQGNGALLKKANPYLSNEDVKKIFKSTVDMYLLEAKVAQLDEVQGEQDMSKIGEVLYRKREYNPYEYPQLAIFEGTTGKMVRKDQMDAISWSVEALNKGDKAEAMRLLQAFAGFGKTKIFSVIVALIVSTHAKEAKLPVIAQIGPLYDTGKSDLSSALKGAFDQFLEVIEKDVGDDVSLEQLHAIADNLTLWKKQGKCLIIKPETWHVINIVYKECIVSDAARAACAKKILDFFKNEGFVVPDEAHLILNPLQEVNKAVGSPRGIPDKERSLIIFNYSVIADSKISGLKENRQASMSELDLKKLQEELVSKAVENTTFFESLDKEQMKIFLTNPEGIRTKWFSSLDKDAQDLLALQHGFIYSLLPHLMSMRGGIDYGDSPKPLDISASPCIDGQPTDSKFSDEYITCALTIQHIIQKGLTEKEVKSVLVMFKEMHMSERLDPGRGRLTESYLNTFLKNKINLDHFDIENPESIKAVTKELRESKEFTEIYIRDIALPTIKVYDEKISSTPQEFLAGFFGGICLSATPGSLETLPLELRHDKNKLDPSSEALALDVMLASRNSTVITIPSEANLEDYFLALRKTDSDKAKKITFLIDRAGQFQKKDPEEVVKCMLGIAHELKGAVYMSESSEGRRQVHAKEGKGADPKPLVGTDLAAGFAAAGLDRSLLKDAFYYYSLMETTGTDWRLPEIAHGVLTVGEGQTVTDTIQAMRRDRQADSSAHSFDWALSEKLLNKIPDRLKQKDGTVTPKDLLIWMICNESDKEEDKVLMRFSQSIQKIKLQAIEREGDGKKFSDACHTKTKAPNSERFTKEEQKDIADIDEKKTYLSSQAKAQLQDLELTESEKKAIDLLVTDTAHMLGKIRAGKKEQLSATEMQKTDQKQQQQEKAQEMAQARVVQNLAGVKAVSEKYHYKYKLDALGDLDGSWAEAFCHGRIEFLFKRSEYVGLPKIYFSKPFLEVLPTHKSLEVNKLEQELLATENRIKSYEETLLNMPEQIKSFQDSLNEMKNPKGDEYKKLTRLIKERNEVLSVATKDLPKCKAKLEELKSRCSLSFLDSMDSYPLRPIAGFLYNKKTEEFIPLSVKGLEEYYSQVAKSEGSYMILGSDGQLVAHSKGLSSEDAKSASLSDNVLKAVAIGQLMQGKIYNSEKLAQLVKPWGEAAFEQFISTVGKRSLGNTSALDSEGVRSVKVLCGWVEVEGKKKVAVPQEGIPGKIDTSPVMKKRAPEEAQLDKNATEVKVVKLEERKDLPKKQINQIPPSPKRSFFASFFKSKPGLSIFLSIITGGLFLLGLGIASIVFRIQTKKKQ